MYFHPLLDVYFTLWYILQILDGNSSFSYVVTKIYNKVPKLDGSWHPILE